MLLKGTPQQRDEALLYCGIPVQKNADKVDTVKQPDRPDHGTVTAREVARAAFEVCEFFEDIADKPDDTKEVERFKAGQRYAAKSIRKTLGAWLTDEEIRRVEQCLQQPQQDSNATSIDAIKPEDSSE